MEMISVPVTVPKDMAPYLDNTDKKGPLNGMR